MRQGHFCEKKARLDGLDIARERHANAMQEKYGHLSTAQFQME
jgi:hypothetical protein